MSEDNLIIKMSTDLEINKFDGEVGKLCAYISTFGNADKVGDVMSPGAFDKFIEKFSKQEGSRLPMLWQHDKNELIGEWTKFEVNSRGVKGYGEIFTDVSRGNDVRNLIKRGAVGSVSIGFTSKNYENLENGGRLFKEVDLVETSVVISPANSRARIVSAKLDDGKIDTRKIESILREAGLSKNESKALLAKGQAGLREVDSLEQTKLNAVTNLSKLLKK